MIYDKLGFSPKRQIGIASFIRGALAVLMCDYALGAAVFGVRILRGDVGEAWPVYGGGAVVCVLTAMGFTVVFGVIGQSGA